MHNQPPSYTTNFEQVAITLVSIPNGLICNFSMALCNRLLIAPSEKQLIGVLTDRIVENNLEAMKCWLLHVITTSCQERNVLPSLQGVEKLLVNDIENFWLTRDFYPES